MFEYAKEILEMEIFRLQNRKIKMWRYKEIIDKLAKQLQLAIELLEREDEINENPNLTLTR